MISLRIQKGDLLDKVEQGVKNGMWFQRLGMKFYVPPENIEAYLNGSTCMVEIHFYSNEPATTATYSAITYRKRWALRKEDLMDLYDNE